MASSRGKSFNRENSSGTTSNKSYDSALMSTGKSTKIVNENVRNELLKEAEREQVNSQDVDEFDSASRTLKRANSTSTFLSSTDDEDELLDQRTRNRKTLSQRSTSTTSSRLSAVSRNSMSRNKYDESDIERKDGAKEDTTDGNLFFAKTTVSVNKNKNVKESEGKKASKDTDRLRDELEDLKEQCRLNETEMKAMRTAIDELEENSRERITQLENELKRKDEMIREFEYNLDSKEQETSQLQKHLNQCMLENKAMNDKLSKEKQMNDVANKSMAQELYEAMEEINRLKLQSKRMYETAMGEHKVEEGTDLVMSWFNRMLALHRAGKTPIVVRQGLSIIEMLNMLEFTTTLPERCIHGEKYVTERL